MNKHITGKISNASLSALAAALRTGALHFDEYLDQLEAHFNAREPEVMAFVPEEGRFARLRRQAEALATQYPNAETRPPLFGVPIGVKDIFHVEGFTTRAGTKVPPDDLQGPEAESVTRLREAGALILGKTVTTEFAYFAPGSTRNPHHPEHTPGGSSSGSAAAVGAGFCPLAFGTQTIGSVTRPASFCGVVGYKPSYDRISRAGVIPLAPSVDHVGAFAAEVEGVTLAAGLLVGNWGLDISNWVLGIGDRKPVLGIPEGPYLGRAWDEGRAHFRAACERLAAAGYEIKHIDAMPDFEDIYARHNLITAAEAAQVHADWFTHYGDLYHPKTVELIKRGQSVSPEELDQALAGREKLRHELRGLMDEHSIDLWISPSAPGAAPRGLESTGDPVMNLPWTHSGLPTLNLPSGTNADGLPIGLQVTARWYADEMLFMWGVEIERVLQPGE